jgi:hypothetical protein
MNDEPIDNNGGRRLATLGIVSILIAFITSGISLFLYTSSGDIYLDRSRPGFIFDDESPKDTEEAKQTAIFPPDGPITKEALSDYLKKLDALVKDISSDPTAFSSDALSDEALNIDGSVDD